MKHFSKRLLAIILSISLFVTGGSLSIFADTSEESTAMVTDDDLTYVVDLEEPSSWGATPNEEQLWYMKQGLSAFVHFGPNTFNNVEWGESYGTTDPSEIFTLSEDFDAYTMVKALQDAGFSRIIVTAKHHDGFCIWQSAYTDYDMGSVDYKDGEGDILAEISEACTYYNMDMGIYLSPWDIHEDYYGCFGDNNNTANYAGYTDYNELYIAWITEICTATDEDGNYLYGNNNPDRRSDRFVEWWLDGAQGSTNHTQTYDWTGILGAIRETNANCQIFGTHAAGNGVNESDAALASTGGIHWIGNENGYASDETWAKVTAGENYESMRTYDSSLGQYVIKGESDGDTWSVPEADTTILSGGWFWSESKATTLRSLSDLGDIYFNSVGHGATLLLNVSPDDTGSVPDEQLERIAEFAAAISETFDEDFTKADGVTASASSVWGNSTEYAASNVLDEIADGETYDETYWAPAEGESSGAIEIDFGQTRIFDVVSIEEYIQKGQSISSFTVEYKNLSGEWEEFASGSTISSKRLCRGNLVAGTAIRITVEAVDDEATPMITNVGVYRAADGFALDSDDTGLLYYTYEDEYSVRLGTVPVLSTEAEGILADGTEVTGTIVWETISSDICNTAGDYTISGTLTFGGYDAISVTATLHVVGDVVAMRNVSTATESGSVPDLPDTVSGVLSDGTISGTFKVTWDNVDASDFTTVGDIVTVSGTAVLIDDEKLPVTCTVRVVEASDEESTNVALSASVSQDIPSGYQSDTLSSVNNGTTKPGDNTDERWSNYGYRNISDTVTLTLGWSEAQTLGSLNLYYYVDSYSAALPASVEIAYSTDGTTYTTIDATETLVESYSYGYEYTYTFSGAVQAVFLQITFTEQSGHCVALTEIEAMTWAGIEFNTSAALSILAVDDIEIDGFAGNILEYTVSGTAASVVTADTDVNAGMTVLPVDDENVVRVLTISEDGGEALTYAVTLSGETEEACSHENTELQNAVDATCTTDGYTGDMVCTDCGELLEEGSVIPATGHSYEVTTSQDATCTEKGSVTYTCSVCGDSYTETIGATGHGYEITDSKAATCEEDGYIVYTCSACGDTYTETIAATGHTWDSGTVTKEATTEEEGEMTYTCTSCGKTKTEVITKELKVPSVSVSACINSSGKLSFVGTYEDYENSEDYYTVTAHGLVYIQTAKLNYKVLTINTTGRTRVNFSKYSDTGTFTYSFTPASKSAKYTVRAFLAYTNENGKTVYVYSDAISVSYNSLSQ